MENSKVSFYRPKEVNIEEFDTIISNMRIDLQKLCAGEYDEETACAYAYSLIHEGRPLAKRNDVLFWGLDEPRNMPADARVDYFYTPSYIATAFLIRTTLFYPELLKNEIFTTKLSRALRGTTLRSFSGHGYENNKGRIEAIRIFASAGTREFIMNYPGICRKFTRDYKNTVEIIDDLVANSQAKTMWGEDFSTEAKEVLEMDKAFQL